MDPQLRETLARTLPPDLFREVVAEVEVAPTGDWVARSRAFALFEPIRSAAQFLRTSLRRRKLEGGRELERYDLEGLLLEAVDRVVDHYGLGESLETETLVSQLAGLLEQNEQALAREVDAAWCRTVAGEAVEVLLNRKERTEDIIEAAHRAYVHRHLVPGPAPRTSTFAFLLLEEATEAGRRVVRARQEAVLFTVRMLDFDLEEMGEILDILLQRQMTRGNFAGAQRTAEQGRQVASGWAAQIRAKLDETRRRPLATGYARQLAPVLEGARRHLAERRERERELHDTVERLRWEAGASGEVLNALAAIERDLEAASRVYASLTRAIAEAPGEHSARRARAFLGRVPPGTWPDPLEEVLRPALVLPAATVECAGPELLRRLVCPSRARLFDLASFVARAFRPVPAPQGIEPERPPDPIQPLPSPELPLDLARELVLQRAKTRPAGCWLSELVEEVAHDRALISALGLVTHDARRDPQANAGLGWAVVEIGPRRTAAGLEFDDLRLALSTLAVFADASGPVRREEVAHVGR